MAHLMKTECEIDDGMLTQLSRTLKYNPDLSVLELDCMNHECGAQFI